MIRTFTYTILSFLLIISTIGLAVSKHYCGGDLVSVSIFDIAESCCDMDGCCENETMIFQVKEDFSAPPVSTIPVLAEIDILSHQLFADLLTLPETEIHNSIFSFSPPPLTIPEILSWKQVYLL